jgi:competence protein ComEC
VNDRWAVALAMGAALGALSARSLPMLVPVVLLLVAFALRRPVVLVVAVAAFASVLAARSYDGLRAPVGREPVSVPATLVSDPEWVDGGGLRVLLRLPGGRRVETFARGPTAGVLRDRLAGEQVDVEGRLSSVPPPARRYLDPRHVSARLTLTAVAPSTARPAAPHRLANAVRRTLVRGSESFDPVTRGLFVGFVLGDDREQPPEVVDDFRASGLSHLLAVSGQNVAFVLALVAPFQRRFQLRGRLVAGLVVLLLFGVVTRWEPSVLRAVAMAALVMVTATLGRPQSSGRILALAVTGLLLVDPLLVRSVGFLLSVGACVGIALFGRRLADALPGPGLVREPLALTLAAQAGVAPVALSVFGGLPVASLPANLLAAPAAGPVMSWGIAAGIPAGLLGGSVAEALHLPTRALVAWTAAVARFCGRLPLGSVRWPQLALVAAAMALAWAVGRRRLHPAAVAAALLMPAALLLVRGPPPSAGGNIDSGVRLWRSGGASVVVADRVRPERLLAALREARVRRIDVFVAAGGGRSALRALESVARRVEMRSVVTPPQHAGSTIRAGPLAVRVKQTKPFEVEVATCTVAGCAWRSGTSSSTSQHVPS